jgi:hypothetical protein
VDDEPEHVVLDEEAVGARLEDKRLGERLWRVVVCLKLSEDVDEYSSVECGLAVDGRDEVGNLLKGQRRDLLHDLGRSLHLLTLERHQRMLGIVERRQLRPRGRVVEERVVLLHERLPDVLVLRVQRHPGRGRGTRDEEEEWDGEEEEEEEAAENGDDGQNQSLEAEVEEEI